MLDVQLERIAAFAAQAGGDAGTGRGAEHEDELAPRLLVAGARLAIAAAGDRSPLQQAARQIGQPEAECVRALRRGRVAEHAADVRIEIGTDVHRRRLPDARPTAFGEQRFPLARGEPGQGIARLRRGGGSAAAARRSGAQSVLQR